ncbi:MAG: hypothetical protein AAB518_01000 [Patescibacteria group bacterium]
MNNNQPSSRNFLPWNISWLTAVLAALAVITFIAISRPGRPYVTPMGIGGVEYSTGSGAVSPMYRDMKGSDLYYPYPYPNPEVPVTDIREFLKIYYSASMRTRDVQGLTRRVVTTVRGYSGRIDQESSSPEYGSVSFSIPQSKYDAFRGEIESFVGNRFLTVSVSSQNLLPQKVSIEEQQEQADTNLLNFKAARQKIVSTHASTVQSLQAKIDTNNQQLATLRALPSTPQLLIQIQSVTDELASFKQQLADENALYVTQLNNADANIKYAMDWQKTLKTQDQTLIDNVATVTGTVSIQWISIWDMARLYLPGYWIPVIFAALAFLSYRRDRRFAA